MILFVRNICPWTISWSLWRICSIQPWSRIFTCDIQHSNWFRYETDLDFFYTSVKRIPSQSQGKVLVRDDRMLNIMALTLHYLKVIFKISGLYCHSSVWWRYTKRWPTTIMQCMSSSSCFKEIGRVSHFYLSTKYVSGRELNPSRTSIGHWHRGARWCVRHVFHH